MPLPERHCAPSASVAERRNAVRAGCRGGSAVDDDRRAGNRVARLRVEHPAAERRAARESLQPEPRRQREHRPIAILLALLLRL
jgi:hypothetical protein